MSNLPDSMYDYRHENKKASRIYLCTTCGGGIYVGDAYYRVDGQVVCEECVIKDIAEDDE